MELMSVIFLIIRTSLVSPLSYTTFIYVYILSRVTQLLNHERTKRCTS